MMNDEIFMKEAIRLSQLAVSHGNEPFGAVLVKDGEIIFSNENQIYTGSDPTFHAEAGLLRRFCAETHILNSPFVYYSIRFQILCHSSQTHQSYNRKSQTTCPLASV